MTCDSNRPSARWRPLLTGHIAAEARSAICHLTERLLVRVRDPQGAAVGSPSLAHGQAGTALCLAYVGELMSREVLHSAAMDALESAAGLLETGSYQPSLFSGYCGVGWTYEHLAGRLFECDGEAGDGSIDMALEEDLRSRPWTGEHDLLKGLAGVGIYALERMPSSAAFKCLGLVIERLRETATFDRDRVSWLTPASRLDPRWRGRFPDGRADCGVAHGIAGLLPVLAAGCAAGFDRNGAPLLEGAVEWLLAQRLDDNDASSFPSFVSAHYEATPAAPRWCYGVPGLSAALLSAATLVEREDWHGEVLAIARAVSTRSSVACRQVRHIGLCHGAMGSAHLLNRIYQTTGVSEVADAAQEWYLRGLELFRRRYLGAGECDGRDAADCLDDGSFLTGEAGVALALAAAISDVPPDWDRILLASVRAPYFDIL